MVNKTYLKIQEKQFTIYNSLQLQKNVTYMILFKIFLSSSTSVVSGNLHNPWLCKYAYHEGIQGE
jgi:DUF4097 and DUF4098 domain-containing protein YvlB